MYKIKRNLDEYTSEELAEEIARREREERRDNLLEQFKTQAEYLAENVDKVVYMEKDYMDCGGHYIVSFEVKE